MRKVLLLLSLLTCLGLVGCQDEFAGSKIIDFDVFQMEVPSPWKDFISVGYDSNTGGITNGRDTLTYDYGWFASDFSHITTATHTRIETVIDGREALIIQPKKKGKDIIGVFVQVDSLNKFSMYGRSKKEATVAGIFHSLRFD